MKKTHKEMFADVAKEAKRLADIKEKEKNDEYDRMKEHESITSDYLETYNDIEEGLNEFEW